MNIADRIQQLRKAKGLSQEELADKIGVSHQSVSKWKSEQTTPDIEKILLMSDFFEVTTNYLLKGIEPAPVELPSENEKPDAHLFTIVGTAFNFFGLIVAEMVWYEEQTALATAVGLILTIVGYMIHGIGMTVSRTKSKEKAKRTFWSVNVWLFAFIPMSIAYNILMIGLPAPYPLLVSPIISFPLFWIVYITACASASLIINKKQ